MSERLLHILIDSFPKMLIPGLTMTIPLTLTAHPEAEIVQLQLNYVDWNSAAIEGRKCYDTAVRHGKSVVVMEPVKGGTLAKLPQKAQELLEAYRSGKSQRVYPMRSM